MYVCLFAFLLRRLRTLEGTLAWLSRHSSGFPKRSQESISPVAHRVTPRICWCLQFILTVLCCNGCCKGLSAPISSVGAATTSCFLWIATMANIPSPLQRHALLAVWDAIPPSPNQGWLPITCRYGWWTRLCPSVALALSYNSSFTWWDHSEDRL